MREVAKRSFDGGREKCLTVLSPSFAIAQQPPRQRGPWVGIIHTPTSLLTILPPATASLLKTCWTQLHKSRPPAFAGGLNKKQNLLQHVGYFVGKLSDPIYNRRNISKIELLSAQIVCTFVIQLRIVDEKRHDF